MDEPAELLHSLRERAASLRRRLALAKQQRPSISSALPPFQPYSAHTSRIGQPSGLNDASGASEEDELARKYRFTGRSCFPVELARGARAKEELQDIERERKRLKGKAKADENEAEEDGFARRGTAVRLETFYSGRFYEPYYVVFAERLPDLHPSSSRPQSKPELYIAHHTVPHWVPLGKLAWRYLGVRVQAEDAHPADQAGTENGGEADLELFLSQLTAYLNAYVSRREQLVSLRSAYSSPSFSALDFRIFASEPCDRIMVEWRIPRERAPKRDEEDGEGGEEDEDEDDASRRSMVVQIAFHDLLIERFERIRDEDGASLLARHVEQVPGVAPRRMLARAGVVSHLDLILVD
ncbi:hypothetical protein JCM8097_008779 [Rhodosporidiobolus ruineniae]